MRKHNMLTEETKVYLIYINFIRFLNIITT